ncbi:MAG: hypothetical protein IJY84_00175 [Clostridia bacterium]|nr:hypothetical protein [Clostridia bacterium]
MDPFQVILTISGAFLFLAICIPIGWLIAGAFPIAWPITLGIVALGVVILLIWGIVSIITWLTAAGAAQGVLSLYSLTLFI